MHRMLSTIVSRPFKSQYSTVEDFLQVLAIFSTTNMSSSLLSSLKNVPVKIGTHSGIFHCDEVLGTYMLQLILPDSVVVRSRDNDLLKHCDIVIDVGNEYASDRLRFDHHQKGFNESISTLKPGKPWTTKLSSAGLVYCHFGCDVIKIILGKSVSSEKLEAVFDHVYENFIQEIDAIDNGFPMFEGEPRYRITTNLSTRVNRLNKQWNAKDDEFNEDEAFSLAQKYVGSEFESCIKHAGDIWWPAREIVLKAIQNRFSVDSSGLVIELDEFCPWKDHFFDLEKKLDISEPILYVIFGDGKSGWRVQAVSLNPGSYICRLFLPSDWLGLRDEELSKIAKVDGCMFAHHTGFIGGNKTRDGALKMALKSIEMRN